MRLGSYPCDIKEGTLAYTIYGKPQISERHRHRWEFNNKYLDQFEKSGMIASGKIPVLTLLKLSNYLSIHFYWCSISSRAEKYGREPSACVCTFHKSSQSLF